MSNYLDGSFNTIAYNSTNIGGGCTVWARVYKCFQGGGYIDTTSLTPGTVIPAGTPVILEGPGKKVTLVTGTALTKANLAKVNGLTFNDVCIPTGVVEATCAVVYSGKVYANRANGGNGLQASLKAQLPGIEFIYEGTAPAEPGS